VAYTNVDLPKDVDGKSIQTLAPIESSAVQVIIAAGNNRIALPTDAVVVEVAASDICRIKFGDSSVDATTGTVARIFPQGISVYRVPTGATHLAVTQFGTSTGFVTLVQMR
jgi:hypothetical protein